MCALHMLNAVIKCNLQTSQFQLHLFSHSFVCSNIRSFVRLVIFFFRSFFARSFCRRISFANAMHFFFSYRKCIFTLCISFDCMRLCDSKSVAKPSHQWTWMFSKTLFTSNVKIMKFVSLLFLFVVENAIDFSGIRQFLFL